MDGRHPRIADTQPIRVPTYYRRRRFRVALSAAVISTGLGIATALAVLSPSHVSVADNAHAALVGPSVRVAGSPQTASPQLGDPFGRAYRPQYRPPAVPTHRPQPTPKPPTATPAARIVTVTPTPIKPSYTPSPSPTTSASSSSQAPPPAPSGSGIGARLLAEAETQAGTPYVYGGAAPGGFDCSGIIYWSALQIGIPNMPRDTYGMLSSGVSSGLLVPTSNPQPGDLAFFGSGHVELFVKDGETFGAHHTGTVLSFRTYGAGYAPTAFYRVT